MTRTGTLFVLSAPSGAGKTTLRDNLRRATEFAYSVSCTTRAPRPGEVDGRDYHFLSEEEFEARAESGRFLEHAGVHGARYGTPIEPVLQTLAAGLDLLVDVDIQGARQIRASADLAIREALADIFLMPPSLEELRGRLERRGTESDVQIGLRLQNAEREMAAWPEYRYTIVSGTPEQDLARFRAIMVAEHCRSTRLRR